MPRPEAMQASSNTVQDSTQIGRPQPVVDRNQNPLLKIDGNSATIWQYTLATLSSLNYSIVGQSKNRYEATIKVDQQIYVLRLTSVGSSNNLAVFNADNSFADQEKAADLLVGSFDFAAYTNMKSKTKSTVRTILSINIKKKYFKISVDNLKIIC